MRDHSGATGPPLAQESKVGNIVVDKSWARATPKGAEVGAGYFVVHNNGETPDRLTGGSADFARVEIHEMKTENASLRRRAAGMRMPYALLTASSRP